MKRILIAALIGLSAAACTGTAGSPTPAPTTGSGSTPTSDSNTSSGLKSLKACELFTDAEAATFGLKLPGEAGKLGTSTSCDWRITGNGGVQVSIDPSEGVKGLNLDRGKVSETKIGKFAATKVEAPDGAESVCDIAISVSETSSVLVISSLNVTDTNTAAACERATKAAEVIAQKLP